MTEQLDGQTPVIGVDIGGTKVAVGVVDSSGKIISQVRHPMVTDAGPDAAMNAVKSAIDSIQLQCEALGQFGCIGVCAPGPLDPKTGIVVNPPNLPCWRDFPLVSRLAEIYHVPVKLDNDANAAALAEVRWGAARGYRYVFYATLGTGIGTGIVLDGHIYHGRTGAAGEGGHVSIDYRGPLCSCGKRGCIEVLAAGPAIAARARSEISKDPGRGRALLEACNGDIQSVSSHAVGNAFAAGDPVAGAVLRETVEYLAVWLGNIVDLLDPDIIVMGGGVSTMLHPLFEEIKNLLPRWCVNPRSHEIPLVIAHYGADTGIAGGAALCSTV